MKFSEAHRTARLSYLCVPNARMGLFILRTVVLWRILNLLRFPIP